MASPSKRIQTEFMQLLMKDFKVEMNNENFNDLFVEFHGPKNSFYEGFKWKVRVELPDGYPRRSPSITFVTKIYHPNVDHESGIICVNILGKDWTPLTTLLDIFMEYLPRLLLNPNADSPLNTNAATMLQNRTEEYGEKVREECRKHAMSNDAGAIPDPEEQPSSSSGEKSEEDVS